MTIGERVKFLRKSLNLTQQQFANALDVDQGHIAGIEKGTKNPSKPLQKVICLTFHVRDIWLKTGEGEMFISPQESVKRQVEHFGAPAVLDAVHELLGQDAHAGAGAGVPAQPPVEQGGEAIDPSLTLSPAEAAIENVLKKIIARHGEQALLKTLKKILKELGIAMAPMRAAHRADTGDPDLDRLINTLYDLWTSGDDKFRGWIEVQFRRAFPDDVVEEAQKKQKETLGQASAG